MKAVSIISSSATFCFLLLGPFKGYHLITLNPVVHASDIPYVFGPSITPYITAPLDLALSLVVQRAYLSFAAHLSPNRLGDLVPGVSWPRYRQGMFLSLPYHSVFPFPHLEILTKPMLTMEKVPRKSSSFRKQTAAASFLMGQWAYLSGRVCMLRRIRMIGRCAILLLARMPFSCIE
jgi:hypothetical protein